jgi:amidase
MRGLLDEHDATGLAELVRRGEVKPVELVDEAIGRIEVADGRLNAVIHRQFERARQDALAASPDGGPFAGVPFLFKDHGCEEAGEPHHQGMRVLRRLGWRAAADSVLALRFRAAGVVPLGRTNLPEMAMMGTTEPAAYGPTHNPWDPSRSPGGSSGGSAAAVAAGLVPAAHANDIAGSIRIPAAQCGLVGLKPSRGWVAGGLEADAPLGMHSEGVVTRSVRDSAGLLDAIGDDESRLTAEVGRPSGTLHIGLCVRAFSGSDVDPGCTAAAVDAARLLEDLGHAVEEDAPTALFEPELLAGARALLAVRAAAELAAWSERIGRPIGEDDVEPTTWQQVQTGRAVSGAEVVRLLATQQAITRRAVSWWEAFDLLLTPTTAEPGPPLGAYKRGYTPGRASAFTRVVNATGQPALSLPLGWPADGLPRGVQLIAAHGREDLLVRVGAQLEAAAPWAGRRPAAVP